MFMELSRSLLGEWGTGLLDFYLANQLIINILVVTYGVAVIIIQRRKASRKRSTKEVNSNERN